MPATVYSGRLFTVTGAQQPRPPYSSAGTLVFQHYENGAWHGGGTESAYSDALPFIVRPSAGESMNLVSATAVGGPQENRLVVSCAVPNSGIGTTGAGQPVSLKVGDGAVYWQSSKPDGTSVAFVGSRFQAPFVSHKLTMTAISAPAEMRSPSGALLQVFGASSSGEMSAAGDLYLRRDGGPPTLLKADPGKKVMLPVLVPVPGGVLMTYMVRDATTDTAVHVSRWDPELRTESGDQTVCSAPGFNYQAYSAIRCADGTIVLPFVYAETSQLASGPWTLDVAVSEDDGASWTRLNQPRTIMADAPVQAGIMEPAAVEAEPGRVAILFRCAAGYIGRVDLDLASLTLGVPYLTNLEAPLAGLSVLKLDSGVIAVAWSGDRPDADPRRPRKVVVLALSEDGLESFSSLHVVSTSESLGDSMVTTTPYVHQPKISEIDGRLDIGVNRVATATDITPYIYKQRGPILVRNVVAPDGEWHAAAMAPSAARLDMLAAFGPAAFEALGMIGAQSSWSAPTILPTGGRWRVCLRTGSRVSAWTPFAVDQASLTTPRLSRVTVTFARPALMTARLISAAGEPLPARGVQLLRNGLFVKRLVSGPDGTVKVAVRSPLVARWSFRFAGNNSIVGVTSAAVRTVPRFALRATVPASGVGRAKGYFSRGVTYRVVARGRLRGALLLGPSGSQTLHYRIHLTRAASRFAAPASGSYSARVVMPGGGTFRLW